MKLIIANLTQEVAAIVDDSYTAAPTDTDVSVIPWEGEAPEIGSIYKNGVFISKWQAATEEEKLTKIRRRRDALIAPTDYAVIRHRDQLNMNLPTTLTEAQFFQILSYRQALRDITNTANLNAEDINNIGWPTKPEFV